MTVGHCPTHHGADSLADAAGGLLACSPYRCEHGEHVGPRYAVNGQLPQLGHGVAFERSQPVCGVLLISPARTVYLVARAGGLAEGWHRGFRRALFGHGVAPVSYRVPVLRRPLPRLRQRDRREAAESYIASPPVNGDALHPRFAPAFGYVQIEAAAVSMAPRSL